VLLTFELEEVKDAFFNVVKLHSGTLRTLAIQKCKINNAFIQSACEALSNHKQFEALKVQYIRECRDINWVTILRNAAALSKDPHKQIQVHASAI